jgi:hypothetical protein
MAFCDDFELKMERSAFLTGVPYSILQRGNAGNSITKAASLLQEVK